MNEDKEVILDNKLINKYALHKMIANGGSIKCNGNFGVRVVYNQNNPESPFIEIRVFVIGIGEKYKGNINPSLAKANKPRHVINIQEDEEIVM